MNTDVLLFTQDISAATQEILNQGGRIAYHVTKSIFVANISASIDVNKLKHSKITPPRFTGQPIRNY
jgi:hypothetical protein